ncbi:MAG: phosphohydrolase [Desulfobacterales bacterium]|jgi:uncharacterized protein
MFDTSEKPLDVKSVLRSHYREESDTWKILLRHGELVAAKALAVADRIAHLKPDRAFLVECAYLHDIGIGKTHTPTLGCHGTAPYIQHGLIGRELLDAVGLHRHGLVCERHVGAGITAADIREKGLPLPERDLVPLTLEEEIICYADQFFSKDGDRIAVARSVDRIRSQLARYGDRQRAAFDEWVERFESSSRGLSADALP